MVILVVDDEARIRDLFRLWLEREGHQVFDAEDGQKAMEVMARYSPEILICDLLMPVQEGIETITRVSEEYPGTCIMAVSGGGKIGPESYLMVAEQLGAWKAYQKPVDMATLIEDIKSWQLRKDIC